MLQKKFFRSLQSTTDLQDTRIVFRADGFVLRNSLMCVCVWTMFRY